MGTQNTASKISKEKNAEGNSTTERLNVLLNKKPAYDILYKEDFGSLKEELIPFEPEKKKFCIRQRKFENNTDVYLMNFLQYYAKFSFLDHIGFSFLALKLSKKSKVYPNCDA